jgi:hypothetical protein
VFTREIVIKFFFPSFQNENTGKGETCLSLIGFHDFPTHCDSFR